MTGLSFNRPKLCPNATWDVNAATFTGSNTIGSYPQSIFINTNNTVYIPNGQNGSIHIWLEGSSIPTSTIARASINTYTLFVTVTGDIYLNQWQPINTVDAWQESTGSLVSTLFVGGVCRRIFIDTNDLLYCTFSNIHKVIRRSLNSGDTQLTTVAGSDCAGYGSDMLDSPAGVFVTSSFDLYVADSGNHRIQLFQFNQTLGITVAGLGAFGTISLRYPSTVTLDADGYLFIVDSSNDRIVGSGPNGFRCVVGCIVGSYMAPSTLFAPKSMAFDSYGNIFVTDTINHRVQKFLLATNPCGKWPRSASKTL